MKRRWKNALIALAVVAIGYFLFCPWPKPDPIDEDLILWLKDDPVQPGTILRTNMHEWPNTGAYFRVLPSDNLVALLKNKTFDTRDRTVKVNNRAELSAVAKSLKIQLSITAFKGLTLTTTGAAVVQPQLQVARALQEISDNQHKYPDLRDIFGNISQNAAAANRAPDRYSASKYWVVDQTITAKGLRVEYENGKAAEILLPCQTGEDCVINVGQGSSGHLAGSGTVVFVRIRPVFLDNEGRGFLFVPDANPRGLLPNVIYR